ncbi:MAG TPA: ester cyclase [Chloroflexia bacterium]|nr:ester cyclase [Chloroflexia bacterium]
MTYASNAGRKDRLARLRRNIEEGGENDLFSRNYVNNAPWHQEKLDTNSVFSDARISVEDMVDGGDKVVVRWRLRGTWSKPFRSIKPTNKPIDVTGINIYRFVGDKIVESTGEFDLAGLAGQALDAGATEEQCSEAMQVLTKVNPV